MGCCLILQHQKRKHEYGKFLNSESADREQVSVGGKNARQLSHHRPKEWVMVDICHFAVMDVAERSFSNMICVPAMLCAYGRGCTALITYANETLCRGEQQLLVGKIIPNLRLRCGLC